MRLTFSPVPDFPDFPTLTIIPAPARASALISMDESLHYGSVTSREIFNLNFQAH
jgi:hypothetical protein